MSGNHNHEKVGKTVDFTIVEVFNRSITIELQTKTAYRAPESYTFLLNGVPVCEEDKNVISIYNLSPDTRYEVGLQCKGETIYHTVRTEKESACLNVRQFGAMADGQTDDTAKLQAAILSCPPKGTVRIPCGIYRTSSLFLKSNITLWIEKGAVLLGETNREYYPVLPGMTPTQTTVEEYNLGTWEGNPLDMFASLLTGIEIENVNIIGEGTLDANAQNGDWWHEVRTRRIAWRPRMLSLVRCSNIRVQGITLQNSYAWTVHPYYSKNISFYDLQIQNNDTSPNTDGIDPESCINVTILGVKISVGDDCVALKSGKYYMACKHWQPTRHVVVRNCLMERGHGGVVIGSEVAGGVEDIHVSQCIFKSTDRGLRVKTRRGRGQRSILRDIVFENVKMVDVCMPFTVNMFYFCDPDGHAPNVQNQAHQPVDHSTPRVENIVARDIVCTGAGVCGVCIYGLPEQPVDSFTLERVQIFFAPEAVAQVPLMMDDFPQMKQCGIFVKNLKNLLLREVTVTGSNDSNPIVVDVKNEIQKEVSYVTY